MAVEEEEKWRESAENLEDAVATVPCLQKRRKSGEDSLKDIENETERIPNQRQ